MQVSHECYSGTPTQFRTWTNALAVAAGYRLEEHVTDLNQTIIRPFLAWDTFTTPQRMGAWDGKPPGDILLVLLIHDQVAGTIDPAEGVPLADRLEGLFNILPADGEFDFHRGRTELFYLGLRAAAAANEYVEFWS